MGGNVWCWGLFSNGSSQFSPKQRGSLDGASDMAVSGRTICAVRSGAIRCLGDHGGMSTSTRAQA